MKRIVACCDGTWDTAASDTNVCKISRLLEDTVGIQKVGYFQGVGTNGNIFQKLAGGISGAGLNKNITEAYGFLVDNYEPGDEIYLLGFSRGAYTVRSLAGFIRKCGLLTANKKGLIDQAFDIYRKRDPLTPDTEEALDFKKLNSNAASVKFLGVWDTVGDLGIPIKWFNFLEADKYKFHDVQLSSTVQFAYHAIGIDEHRKLFDVTPWEKSKNATLQTEQTIEQVWFVGSHGDIGGGFKESKPGDGLLSNRTLLWMIEKAKGAGLTFKQIGPEPYNIINNKWTESVSGVLWWTVSLGKKFYRQELSCSNYPDQSINVCVYARKNAGVGYNPPYLPSQPLTPQIVPKCTSP